MCPISILHIDDSLVFQDVLSRFLEARMPDCRITGTARSRAEALTLGMRLQPDLVVCDLSMPGLSDLLPQLRALLPDTRIVGLSLFPRYNWDGVDIYVSKSDLLLALPRVIQRLFQSA